jgi:predicted nucleic acid-binding protein
VARIALDADVVIAFLDAANDQHEQAVSALRPRLTTGEDIILSASVYAEIMVRPMARGTDATVDEFLVAINATVIAVDRPIARLAAQLRGRHRSLRLPDALSLATALAADAELLTLDNRLSRIEAHEQTPP